MVKPNDGYDRYDGGIEKLLSYVYAREPAQLEQGIIPFMAMGNLFLTFSRFCF